MTQTISREVVEQTWQEIAALGEEEAVALAVRMREEQSTYYNFLYASDNIFTQNEKELIFYIGTVVWQMMNQSERILGKVSKGRLEQASRKNNQLMVMLSKDTEADFFSAVQALIADYPETEVLRYIAEAVLEESDDPSEPGFRDDVKGPAFVQLKTGLDALIYSLWKTRQ